MNVVDTSTKERPSGGARIHINQKEENVCTYRGLLSQSLKLEVRATFKKTLVLCLVSIGSLSSGTITRQVLANSPPVVSNVNACQRTDCSKKVDIYYDLSDADGDKCIVSVKVSDNGGATWDVNAITFTGDIGAGITPGTDKHIIWDCGTDLPGVYGTSYRVRIYADDGYILNKPVIYIQSPTSKITDRRPLIKARIYSPDKIDIDLSSIELELDGAIVTHTITPETGGSDITISYTPINDLSINNPDTSGVNEGRHTIVINAKDVIGLIAQEKSFTFDILPFTPRRIVELMRAINQRQRIVSITQTIFYNYMPGRTPYKISLGEPDGGNTVPSIDALDNFMFLPEYISDLRNAIKDSLIRYWNTAAEKTWTLSALYQSAMGTTGTGAGKDTWTHTFSQMSTNGIETIDLLELQKCIEKLDTPMIAMENKQGMEYYYLRKWSLYNPAYGYYGSYNDCQNATPDTKDWSGGGTACGQLTWKAIYDSKSWYIGRYYWSFDTSVLSGLNLISAKLRWRRVWPLTLYKYYRHFTLNFRQTSFDAKSPRIPGDWSRGGVLVASRNSETWNEKDILLEGIPISFVNTSASTQFELTSSRDEAKDGPPVPSEEGEGYYEQVQEYSEWDGSKYVRSVYLIVNVTGLKN